jgi:hypothetical protein
MSTEDKFSLPNALPGQTENVHETLTTNVRRAGGVER